MTNDHLDSLDATLAAARKAWDDEKKSLNDRIFALETENALIKGLHADAIKARSAAENVGTKLLTQFAVVGHVFEEARAIALSVGYDVQTEAEKAVASAKAKIDAVAGTSSSAFPPPVQIVPFVPPIEAPHVPT